MIRCQPPAESVLDLTEKLRAGQGLGLSNVMDGCGARQQKPIRFASLEHLRDWKPPSSTFRRGRRKAIEAAER